MNPYGIIELSSTLPRERDEQLGSKSKFWFRHTDGALWLFKFSRPNTGEHWSEKLAAEVATSLGIPSAQVELAVFTSKYRQWGAMSRDFTNEGHHGLVHGNELLTELDPGYPSGDTYRVSAHTLGAVHAVLSQEFVGVPPSPQMPEWLNPFDVFVGYLMLDALIGNTDRHHENWGVLTTSSQPRRVVLAPTYDHASSLGRELTDEGRARKFGRGAGYDVARYLGKARSALYEAADSEHPFRPIEAFRAAAKIAPLAGQYWLNVLRARRDDVLTTTTAIPAESISGEARAFCAELLVATFRQLLE